MSVHEDVERLMVADRFLAKVDAQIKHLPEADELAEVERQLRELAERQRLLDLERRPTRESFDEAVASAETLRRRKTDLEERLGAASAPARELEAMHRELENLTSRLSDAEDTEVTLLLELEPLDEVAELIHTEAQPLAQRRHELQGTVRELTVSALDEQAHLRVEREQVASVLPAEVRQRYESALARSGTSGAACVERDRCDGCRITLPPLDRDRLKTLDDNAFMACPSCGRLLLTC